MTWWQAVQCSVHLDGREKLGHCWSLRGGGAVESSTLLEKLVQTWILSTYKNDVCYCIDWWIQPNNMSAITI